MTKIAISPNVNGTGTFTLAAPDSNTNRTLTLPDAGGEVFSQGNIVGTVSQSAGVPTGGIIQRGSNANGEFVRFADGTQICTTVARIFPVDIVTGNIFRGLDSEDRPWPAEFIEVPATIHCPGPSLSNVTTFSGSSFGTSATNVRCRLLGSISRGDQDAFSIGIGRWF